MIWDPDTEANIEKRKELTQLAWDKTRNAKVDIRLYYAHQRDAERWTKCRWSTAEGSPSSTLLPTPQNGIQSATPLRPLSLLNQDISSQLCASNGPT